MKIIKLAFFHSIYVDNLQPSVSMHFSLFVCLTNIVLFSFFIAQNYFIFYLFYLSLFFYGKPATLFSINIIYLSASDDILGDLNESDVNTDHKHYFTNTFIVYSP